MVTTFQRAARRMRELHNKNRRQAVGIRSGNLAVVLYETSADGLGRLRVVRICGFPPWTRPVHELRAVAGAVLGPDAWRAGELLEIDDGGECRGPAGNELSVGGRAGRFGGAAYWAVVALDRRERCDPARIRWYEPAWVRWLEERTLGAPLGQYYTGTVCGPGVQLVLCSE